MDKLMFTTLRENKVGPKIVKFIWKHGLKECLIGLGGGALLIGIVAAVFLPFFVFAHLGDIWHPAWAFIGWIFWFVVLWKLGKMMDL